jgi:hypothetical protein
VSTPPAAWRFACASVAGAAHVRDGRPCQDAGLCALVPPADEAGALLACGADGAGSAPRGEEGARLACATFVATVEGLRAADRVPAADDTIDDDETPPWWSAAVDAWLTRFHDQVERRAERSGSSRRDFACTFLGALVGQEWAALVQIGDGAIVVDQGDDPDAYASFVWPQRGEYANETYFATEPRTAERIAVGVVCRRVEEIALLTDGLQGLVLDYARRAPHGPFFERMFSPVRAAPPGESGRLSASLAAFLGSASVRARTDDDTTLILATRRSGPGDGVGKPDGAGI